MGQTSRTESKKSATSSFVSPLRSDFIPRRDYVGGDIFDREIELLWPKVWQTACRVEELKKVGDFVRYDIANESFLIVRTGSDTYRAFYNVCPHRGRRLKTESHGNVESGIVCGFHAWSWDRHGTLRSIPLREDWDECATFVDSELNLIAPQVGLWGGWIWINMDPNAPPLIEYLSPAAEKLKNFELENTRLLWHKSLHFPVNWKVVLEAFIEGYHTNGTHPQLLKYGKMAWPGPIEQGLHTTHTSEIHGLPPGMDARQHTYEMMVELNKTLLCQYLDPCISAAKRLLTELPPGMPSEEVYGAFWKFHKEEMEATGAKWPENLQQSDLWSTAWHIFPNTSILPTIDGGLVYRMRPDGMSNDKCILDMWALARFAPGKEPSPPHEIYPTLESFKGQNPFLEQDFRNLLAVQVGMQSRAWAGGRPNPHQETTVVNFHKNLRRYLNLTD